MSIFSTLRSRQFANRQNQAKQQIIAFRLFEEWFAVPILAVYKVIPLGKIYGDPGNKGISFTNYDDKELLVIDVAKYIFSGLTNSNSPETKTTDDNRADLQGFEAMELRYLIILEDQNTNLVGLPIDSQPLMYRVEQSAFKALPQIYLEKTNIQYISSQIIEIPETPVMFFLDTEKLTTSVITAENLEAS